MAAVCKDGKGLGGGERRWCERRGGAECARVGVVVGVVGVVVDVVGVVVVVVVGLPVVVVDTDPYTSISLKQKRPVSFLFIITRT